MFGISILPSLFIFGNFIQSLVAWLDSLFHKLIPASVPRPFFGARASHFGLTISNRLENLSPYFKLRNMHLNLRLQYTSLRYSSLTERLSSRVDQVVFDLFTLIGPGLQE